MIYTHGVVAVESVGLRTMNFSWSSHADFDQL
jgi:hypothetical protein